MTAMTISKVAKKAGVGIETVRFYERKGLVDQPPKPPSGGYRVYPAETGERIRFIRQARRPLLSKFLKLAKIQLFSVPPGRARSGRSQKPFRNFAKTL